MNSNIISFAIEAHSKTNHLYDGKPYSVHLAMVVMYAQKYIDLIPSREHQSNVLSACWLHDTIEDCRLTYNDIKEIAGFDVAEIVYAVTNDKGKNRKERASESYYSGIRSTAWASFVKLCDRLANVKYSKDTDSRMYAVYMSEQHNFISSLFPDNSSNKHYASMINELYELLGMSNTFILKGTY